MKLFLLAAAALISSSAFAAPIRDVELTTACENTLIDFAVKAEYKFLADQGETLASKLEGVVYTSYWPAKEDMSVSVQVEDKADGRYVNYRAKVLKVDALACKINVKRDASTACRYSTGDGPEGLNEIKGLKFVDGEKIAADAKLTKLQAEQIKAFLGNNGSDDNVKELIEGTDDSYLSTGTLTLPNGKVLSYLGAYGGDNPFGIFFEQGTTKVAGENGDGSVCIQ
jgi:hypothetical protein